MLHLKYSVNSLCAVSNTCIQTHTHTHTHTHTCYRGLIILIDSVNFPKECIDVAGMLYDMFSNKTLMSMRMPLLIACNKQGMCVGTYVCMYIIMYISGCHL